MHAIKFYVFFFLNNEFSATALGHDKVVQTFLLRLILNKDISIQLTNATY